MTAGDGMEGLEVKVAIARTSIVLLICRCLDSGFEFVAALKRGCQNRHVIALTGHNRVASVSWAELCPQTLQSGADHLIAEITAVMTVSDRQLKRSRSAISSSARNARFWVSNVQRPPASSSTRRPAATVSPG